MMKHDLYHVLFDFDFIQMYNSCMKVEMVYEK